MTEEGRYTFKLADLELRLGPAEMSSIIHFILVRDPPASHLMMQD